MAEPQHHRPSHRHQTGGMLPECQVSRARCAQYNRYFVEVRVTYTENYWVQKPSRQRHDMFRKRILTFSGLPSIWPPDSHPSCWKNTPACPAARPPGPRQPGSPLDSHREPRSVIQINNRARGSDNTIVPDQINCKRAVCCVGKTLP